MYSASRLPPSLLAEKGMYLDQLRCQGHFIVERLVADEIVERVNCELERWFSATPRCRGNLHGWHATRFGAVLLKWRTSHALVLNELILLIMDDVPGPHGDWYQLNLSQGIRIQRPNLGGYDGQYPSVLLEADSLRSRRWT